MSVSRIVAAVLWLALTAAILLVTLGPIPQRLVGSEATFGVLSISEWLDPLTWSQGRVYEFGLNLLMFVPWGALAVFALGVRRWWLAALLGVALTLTIEIAQIPSPRISDPRDLVANSIGAAIGIVVAMSALVPGEIARRRQAARLRLAA